MSNVKQHPRKIESTDKQGQLIRTAPGTFTSGYMATAKTEFGEITTLRSPNREAAVKRIIRKIRHKRAAANHVPFIVGPDFAKQVW